MRRPEYDVICSGVLDYVDNFAPDDVYDEFYNLLESLMEDGPYHEDQPSRGILPLQDETKPNGFTAPFDAGLLAYQVMKDFPIIKCVDVFWIIGEDDDPTGIDYAF